MSGLLRASVHARLERIVEDANRIRENLRAPMYPVIQLDADLDDLATLARNLADNNNRDD